MPPKTPPAIAAAAIDVIAPVTEVTVLEDRAHVVRSGRVKLPVGASTVRVSGVAPVLSDKTAIATVTGARVGALRVVRQRVIASADQPASIAALIAQQRPLERERERGAEELRLTGVELEQLGQVLSNTIAEIGEDAAWAKDATQEWKSSLDRIADRERELRLRSVELEISLQDAERIIGDLQQRIDAASGVHASMSAIVVCDVHAEAAGEQEFRLAYIVPGACWRPYHSARLSEEAGKAQVEFSCDASVWQNTGEDWNAVALRCSTERASLGTAPPLLASDQLSLKRKEQAITVDVREQAVQTTGGEAGAPAAEVMGIDDGGETRLLSCQGPATIPSDGMSHRMPLFQFSAPVESTLTVIGELAPAAILRTGQANTASQPLLAGPVDLIRRGGLAGRSKILYVAPGARFDLGWGPDGDIRIHRSVHAQPEKGGMMSSWTSTLHHVDLNLSNLSSEARTVEVTERVPVSSLDQVVIEVDQTLTQPAAKADENGFVRWIVALPARGHARIALRYRMRKHPDVAGV